MGTNQQSEEVMNTMNEPWGRIDDLRFSQPYAWIPLTSFFCGEVGGSQNFFHG
jgi:hypothetical protein